LTVPYSGLAGIPSYWIELS